MSSKAAPEAKPASPASSFTPARSPLLQRKCACGGSAGGGGECDECHKKKHPLQRRAASPSAVASVPPIVHRVLDSPGRPLDAGTRGFMESRFGHDFSQVRVHTDSQAGESARAVNAHAYTVGQDIAFAPGKYNPGLESGRRLLAHELAHTVQQQGLHRSAAGIGVAESGESQQLEREADTMANAVMRGSAVDVTTGSRVSSPIISRVAAGPDPTAPPPPVLDWEDAPAGLVALGVTHQSKTVAGVSPKIRAFKVGAFKLPTTKGPVRKAWEDRAKAGALQAIVDAKEEKAALWQHRAPTKELQKRWLGKVKWSEANAAANWYKAGGDQLTDFSPKVNGETCQMDHIVELQIGGNNTQENIQALGAESNRASGIEIWQTLRQLAVNIRGAVPGLEEVILHFDDVAQTDGACATGCAKPPAAGAAASCCEVEQCAPKIIDAAGAAAAAAAGLLEYPLEAGGATTKALVPPPPAPGKKEPEIPIHESPTPQNVAASELISGMILKTLHRSAAGDAIDGCIESDTCSPKSRKTRLPVTLAKAGGVAFTVEKGTGKLKLKTTNPNLGFTYPFLSKGTITKLAYDPATGVSGSGTLKPSLPLLSKMQLGVAFTPDSFKITAGLDPAKITLPIPGAKLTKAELALELAPEFKPSGTLAFELAPGGKKLVDGSLTIEPNNGLSAKGKLNAYLPGVDKAEGTIQYLNNTWSGGVEISSSQIKLPYIKSGSAMVAFSDKGIVPSGQLVLAVPGGHEAEVKLERRNSKWVFSGKGVFNVPRLDPVTVHVVYDGEHITGSGKTGFKFQGLKGNVEIAFYDGKVSGKGEIDVVKGRAKGKIVVKLSPAQKFSGEGTITYQVSENLIATAGIILDEHEKVTLKGALEFPKPLKLFEGIKGQKEIFRVGISIPIPGASIGPIGIKARIEGALGVHYGVGPGEIQNLKIEATINPLDENPDFDAQLVGRLYIPASAGIDGSVSGKIVLDIGIASVSGGLTVMASVNLNGKVQADVKIHYSKSRFDVKALAEISAALVLGLALKASVEAEAGIGPFSVSTEKEWTLASYQYNTGLQFGMKAPLYYASDQPFKPPSLDDIEIIKPNIDPSDMLKKIFGGSTANEKEK